MYAGCRVLNDFTSLIKDLWVSMPVITLFSFFCWQHAHDNTSWTGVKCLVMCVDAIFTEQAVSVPSPISCLQFHYEINYIFNLQYVVCSHDVTSHITPVPSDPHVAV